MKIRAAKIISSLFGTGFLKGGGTFAAGITVIAWYFAAMVINQGRDLIFLLTTVLIIVIGVWTANLVEKDWGEDSHRVVIDESAGMCISLLFLSPNIYSFLAAFLLFRFFDIVKPLYIRRMESLPRGWGVMADDVLAGIYTNLILGIVTRIKLH
jgi:phosphatidylglycerophosphatase A